MNSVPTEAPWYRQFWPWLLIALPTSAVIACAITIWLVLQNPDPVLMHEVVPVNDILGANSVTPPKR